MDNLPSYLTTLSRSALIRTGELRRYRSGEEMGEAGSEKELKVKRTRSGPLGDTSSFEHLFAADAIIGCAMYDYPHV